MKHTTGHAHDVNNCQRTRIRPERAGATRSAVHTRRCLAVLSAIRPYECARPRPHIEVKNADKILKRRGVDCLH